jgi:hypothetical protein
MTEKEGLEVFAEILISARNSGIKTIRDNWIKNGCVPPN